MEYRRPVRKGLRNMYKKAVALLISLAVTLMACVLCVRELDAVGLYSEPVQSLKLRLKELETEWAGKAEAVKEDGEKGLGIADVAVSGQRTVAFLVVEQQYMYDLPDTDLEVLLRIVEAEAGNEDEDGKLLVANVVLNRLNSEAFPDTVTDVVFQREKGVSQFSPVSNGSYYRVKVSEETVNAVERALMGEDISQGALYFVARKYADSRKVEWFDRNLTYLFVHGGHEFFK